MEKSKAEDKYLSIVPSPSQKKLQEMGFYMFIHFGMNTMFGSEGGDGKEDPSAFSMPPIDTDKWARLAKEIGAGAIIFTAKHQEGFCLWQTKTTEHSIKNSPYMGGKGDIVRSLSDSCARYGIKLGFYLSPADRNCAYYGTNEYNDFYCRQLTELLTDYGDVFCLWFDVNQSGELNVIDGKRQDFDYERVFALAKKLRPGIILANGGPDVRWVGNEASKTRTSEWNVVPSCVCPAFAKKYKGKVPAATATDEDLGSDEVLSMYDEYLWYPAEVDYSLHKGWFYHPFEMPRSLPQLYSAYMRSVGGNCTFLLNVPPDKKGCIVRCDVLRLHALKRKIDKTFSRKLTDVFEQVNDKEFCCRMPKEGRIKTIVLREDIDFSQRVKKYSLFFYRKDSLVFTKQGTVVGFSSFVRLKKAIRADKVVFVAEEHRGDKIFLRSFELYE